MAGPTADLCEKCGGPMLLPRPEISAYASSCEHLISLAASPHAVPFTQDEIEWIAYYLAEMTQLVDELIRKSKPQASHDRQTLNAFAVASGALFLLDDISEGEKDRIRQLVSDVNTNILEREDPA